LVNFICYECDKISGKELGSFLLIWRTAWKRLQSEPISNLHWKLPPRKRHVFFDFLRSSVSWKLCWIYGRSFIFK